MKAITIPDIIQHPSIKHLSLKNGRVFAEFVDGCKEEYDKIIFATGYHTYYPFMDQCLFTNLSSSKSTDKSKPERIKNLYSHTFYNKDPTLCHLGL